MSTKSTLKHQFQWFPRDGVDQTEIEKAPERIGISHGLGVLFLEYYLGKGNLFPR